MQDNTQMTGINPNIAPNEQKKKKIISYSNHHNQTDNIDDRLSMFANDSPTIVTSSTQVPPARENIHTYKKVTSFRLYEGKTIITKLGKAHKMNISQKTFNVNFSIMKDKNNETYLGNVIKNNVTEEQEKMLELADKQ